MGTLHYGNGMVSAVFPDEVLAHVRVVATSKLRRGESFMLTWRPPKGSRVGRSTLWMQPSIPLLFEFDSDEPITLDPDFLHTLANAANSVAGMSLDSTDGYPTSRPGRAIAA